MPAAGVRLVCWLGLSGGPAIEVRTASGPCVGAIELVPGVPGLPESRLGLSPWVSASNYAAAARRVSYASGTLVHHVSA